MGETKVTIMGVQATIKLVSGKAADDIFRKEKENMIEVWLELEKPIDGTIGFGFNLPAKKYEKFVLADFLEDVEREGNAALKRILDQHKKIDEKMKIQKERYNKVEAIAEGIKRAIGLLK